MSINLKSYADPQRWICIYPSYINSKKTVVQGRKIVLSNAIENPTSQEIFDVLKHAGLKCKIEEKMYPRDPNRNANCQGRVRIQLKNEDGTICNKDFQTRKSIMLYASKMIPKLKTRQTTTTANSVQQSTTSTKQKKKR